MAKATCPAPLSGSQLLLKRPLITRAGASGHAGQEGTRLAANQTAATVSFSLQNNTGSDTVYAFVTGLSLGDNNALVLIESDGQTLYFPSSPSSAGRPLGANCAIPLGPSGGAPVTVTVPQLAGARLWFSIGTPITFLLNPGPALVEPSVTNPSDPNINIAWDFAEFTYNSAQLFANISMVDFTCLPIGLTLSDTSGHTTSVAGLPAGALDSVCSSLTAQQNADSNSWTDLIISSSGQNLRALSPQNGLVGSASFLSGYYDSYVSHAWQKYTSRPP